MPTLTQLLEVLKLDPSDPVTHFSLGSAYRSSGDVESAMKHFRLAAEHKPDYSAAWFELARLAEAQGDLEAALDAYDGAMAASGQAGDDHILNAARVRKRRLERQQEGG